MARTYKRDSRGRFASTGGSSGGGRPAAKPVSRGTNRLTRDNAGRITSVGGNGATARGGRLRTAAGNLRARQIDRVNAAPKGVVSRSGAARAKVNVQRGRATAATSRLRPGELMNANARPVNTMARFRKGENPYNRFSGHTADNVATAVKRLKKQGFNVYEFNNKNNPRIAEALLGVRSIGINTASEYWSNPRLRAIEYRRSGHLSTSSPMGVIHHEIKHTKDKASLARFQRRGQKGIDDWKEAVPGIGGPASKLRESWRRRNLAGRVSGYARTSPAEFIAETYAGLRTGRRYDYQVMGAYREAQGLSQKPAARRRSRVRRGP